MDTAIKGITRFVLRLVGRLLPANLRRAADLIATPPAPTPSGTVAVAHVKATRALREAGLPSGHP